MSYILEALKRAERERKLGQAPAALDEVAAPPPVTKAKAGPRNLLIGLAAIVVAALAGYAVFLFRGPPPAAPVAAPELPVAAAPVPAPAPAPVTVVATPDGSVDARIEDGGEIASLDDLTDPAADPAAAQAAAELAAAQQAAALQAQAAAAAAYSQDAAQGADTPSKLRTPNPVAAAPRPQPAPAAVPPPPAASSSIQLDANPLTAQPAVNTPEPTPAPPPVAAIPEPQIAPAPAAEFRRLKDMPAGFRSEFPPLSVDVHVYNDNPQRRFVLITGKRYRETDVIAEGPRIARIVPEGIVFDWRNEQVLFPVR